MTDETLSAQDKADLAAIRKQLPQGDPRAAKIDALIGAEPPQKGFLGSFADASGISSLPNLISHPIDSISQGIKQTYQQSRDAVRQGVAAYKAGGLSQDTRRDFGRAVPIIGPMLAQAQSQHDAGNDVGMAGTLAGGITGFVAPEAGASAVGRVLQGTGKLVRAAGASGPSLKLAATRALVPGEAGAVLQRALKPGVQYGADVHEMLADTIPNAMHENPGIQGVKDYAKALDDAKDTQHKRYTSLRDPNVAIPVDTTPMVGAQVNSIPATNEFETPGIVGATRDRASVYDMTPQQKTVTSPILDERGNPITKTVQVQPVKPTLGQLDAIREDTNAKLNSFYNKEGGDRNAALSNPNTSRLKAVNDGVRELVYSNLSDATGVPVEDIRDMQRQYGKISEAQEIAGKRDTVFGRHDPVGLPEKLAIEGGSSPLSSAYKYGVQKLVRGLTDSDALVRSAIDRYQNPKATPLVIAPIPAAAGNGLKLSGAAIRRFSPFANGAAPILMQPGRADE